MHCLVTCELWIGGSFPCTSFQPSWRGRDEPNESESFIILSEFLSTFLVNVSAWYGLEDESTRTRFNKFKYFSLYCSQKINTPTALPPLLTKTRCSRSSRYSWWWSWCCWYDVADNDHQDDCHYQSIIGQVTKYALPSLLIKPMIMLKIMMIIWSSIQKVPMTAPSGGSLWYPRCYMHLWCRVRQSVIQRWWCHM